VDAVKRIPLKEFLAMKASEVLELPVQLQMDDLIREWAIGQQPDQGQLPGRSASAFATWLDQSWEDWSDDEDATVKDILSGAVTEWCGGRSF
jgi:hypothetical protein